MQEEVERMRKQNVKTLLKAINKVATLLKDGGKFKKNYKIT